MGRVGETNSIARPQPGRSIIRCLLDRTGSFVAGHIWRLPGKMIVSATAIDVGEVQADRFRSNDGVPRNERGFRHVTVLQHAGLAELVKEERFHANCPAARRTVRIEPMKPATASITLILATFFGGVGSSPGPQPYLV